MWLCHVDFDFDAIYFVKSLELNVVCVVSTYISDHFFSVWNRYTGCVEPDMVSSCCQHWGLIIYVAHRCTLCRFWWFTTHTFSFFVQTVYLIFDLKILFPYPLSKFFIHIHISAIAASWTRRIFASLVKHNAISSILSGFSEVNGPRANQVLRSPSCTS